jgi:hypothetical protein
VKLLILNMKYVMIHIKAFLVLMVFVKENAEQNLVYNPKKFYYFVSFAGSSISKIRKVGCYMDFGLKTERFLGWYHGSCPT